MTITMQQMNIYEDEINTMIENIQDDFYSMKSLLHKDYGPKEVWMMGQINSLELMMSLWEEPVPTPTMMRECMLLDAYAAAYGDAEHIAYKYWYNIADKARDIHYICQTVFRRKDEAELYSTPDII